MRKKQFKNEIKKSLEEMYVNANINEKEEYQKILKRVDFDKNTEIIYKPSNKVKKKIWIPILTFFCLLLISISSLTTYFITKKDNSNVLHSVVSNDEYIKEAENYIIQYCDYVVPFPKQTNYIDSYGIINFYEAYKFTDIGMDKLFFVQLHSLTQELSNLKVVIENQNKLQYIISSDGVNANVMGCLNDLDDFLIFESEATIYGYYIDSLILKTKIIF